MNEKSPAGPGSPGTGRGLLLFLLWICQGRPWALTVGSWVPSDAHSPCIPIPSFLRIFALHCMNHSLCALMSACFHSVTLCFMDAPIIHSPLLMTCPRELTLANYSTTLSTPLVFELLVSLHLAYDFIMFSLMPMCSVLEGTLPGFLLHFSW